MRRIGPMFLAASLFVGCGGPEVEPSQESLERAQAPLTATDVDVAPECEGILTFTNTASYATLDAYLPSDVATRLVTQRATAPFTTLAQVSAVQGMGEARLKQLEGGARAQGAITTSCAGIFDELALSADDASAIVALVNTIDDSELHDVLPDAWNGAANLLGSRPFTSVQAISNMAGIGPVSLRNIRNSATLSRPLEALINAVNAIPQYDYTATLARHFDWWQVAVGNQHYREGGMTCFGLEPTSTPYGATVRPNLADATEVRDTVTSAVSFANRNNVIPSGVVSAGLANLDMLTAGRSFKGCYLSYQDDPWSGHQVAIFVDTVNGFSVMTDRYWSE